MYVNVFVCVYVFVCCEWPFFSTEKQPNLSITMDCSQAVLVAQDQVIVTLQKGDMWEQVNAHIVSFLMC